MSLEQYRQEAIRDLEEDALYIKAQASKLLGIPVKEVWIHGSVLDPKKFTEDSDVDILLVVKTSGPKGPREDLSLKVAGKIPCGEIGYLDAIVVNQGTKPHGKRISSR